ncbi:MAG: glycosyltransferase [Rhodanobacter sp.]
MKKVLMIAFHFPPVAMGSGHLRTLGFVRYLPPLGWEPIVLSANALAFPRSDAGNNKLIPEKCHVHRAFALDASRHMGIAGKYPGILAQPDRWISWWPAAVVQGLRLIRRHQISAIWSTYPIMTAHCIAHTLSSITKLPWIADFRDPVASSVSAANRFAVASQHRWEGRVLNTAARTVFTTPGALQNYAERYPEAQDDGRLAVIENGYDEAAFRDLPQPPGRPNGRPLVLLHSGLLYPEGRNPFPFLAAVAGLNSSGEVGANNLRIVLRASGSEELYGREIKRLGLEEIVVLAKPVSNGDALIEQANADALLLFQGSQFDRQIPAKLYEYLRIGRPIFALVTQQGDTAAVLRASGGATIVSPDDVTEIGKYLATFIRDIRAGSVQRVKQDFVEQRSRQAGASSLAQLLEQVVR